jgi:hypothetical protein
MAGKRAIVLRRGGFHQSTSIREMNDCLHFDCFNKCSIFDEFTFLSPKIYASPPSKLLVYNCTRPYQELTSFPPPYGSYTIFFGSSARSSRPEITIFEPHRRTQVIPMWFLWHWQAQHAEVFVQFMINFAKILNHQCLS